MGDGEMTKLQQKRPIARIDYLSSSGMVGERCYHYDYEEFLHRVKENNYYGRGISGQTSPQMLLRFQADVIALQPDVVVINAGTNDIAENTGTYHPSFTLNNIKSMAEVAKANGIKVILTSVLPHDRFGWNKSIENVTQKVDELNVAIQAYAKANKIPYVDYNAEMRDAKGAMKEGLSKDGVHPYPDAYLIMEALVKPVIDKQLKKKK